MTSIIHSPPLFQLAFSVVDLRRTEAWFHDGLGFLPAGGNIRMMSGPIASRVQGVPGAASCAWWMVARNAWFQLELFQFRRPVAKLMPADFRPCDTGYTRMGVHVEDFDRALANLARIGSEPLAPPVGAAGNRRACVRNPDGVYVEIMEDDPLPPAPGTERKGCPVAVRSVTLSTPDFDASVAVMTALYGKGPEKIALHEPEHEAIWGLPGARCKRAVFLSGDVLLEVVQYTDPVGKPWPEGYRICDQGILNVAYGSRSRAGFTEPYERLLKAGAKPNFRPLFFNGGGIVYVNDPLGFSVEFTWMPQKRDFQYGFEPRPRDERPLHDKYEVTGSVRIAAPPATVWKILNEHEAMSLWCGFQEVVRTRDGTPVPDGYGAERLMQGKPGRVMEQITGIEPGRSIRYRLIQGGPIRFHNGEILLQPGAGGCDVRWTIRFGSKYPLLGPLLRRYMQKMLVGMLRRGLRSYAEWVARTT